VSKLNELIEREGMRLIAVHSGVRTVGPYAEEEVFDILVTREREMHITGGPMVHSTLLVRGVVTSRQQSMRENAGVAVPPKLDELLPDWFTSCNYIENSDGTFRGWFAESRDGNATFSAEQLIETVGAWEWDKQLHNDLRTFLGAELYQEFMDAYLAGEFE
jgi:hypothetical protein